MTADDPLLLINAFLGKVGSAGQVFDENNSLALSFDGITIGIRKDDIRQLLVVNAVIAAMPRPSDAASAPALAAAYADILDASLGGIMTGAGALGLTTWTTSVRTCPRGCSSSCSSRLRARSHALSSVSARIGRVDRLNCGARAPAASATLRTRLMKAAVSVSGSPQSMK